MLKFYNEEDVESDDHRTYTAVYLTGPSRSRKVSFTSLAKGLSVDLLFTWLGIKASEDYFNLKLYGVVSDDVLTNDEDLVNRSCAQAIYWANTFWEATQYSVSKNCPALVQVQKKALKTTGLQRLVALLEPDSVGE